jgi:hypothetical protein
MEKTHRACFVRASPKALQTLGNSCRGLEFSLWRSVTVWSSSRCLPAVRRFCWRHARFRGRCDEFSSLVVFTPLQCNYITQRHRQYHRSTHNDIVRYRATDSLNTITHDSLDSLYKDGLMLYLLIIPISSRLPYLIRLILLFVSPLKRFSPIDSDPKSVLVCPGLSVVWLPSVDASLPLFLI